MGTGGRMNRGGRGREAAPVLAGLPHRRYSVPETIMRKYKLTKQHSDSNSDGAVTVPNITPENMRGATSRSGVGSGSSQRSGKTPPSDRSRKQGRGFEENTFRRPARVNGQSRSKKGPPMYRGRRGLHESASEEGEEKVAEVRAPLKQVDSSPEVKSPDCLECKNFLLDVITEESEKAKTPKCSSEGRPDMFPVRVSRSSNGLSAIEADNRRLSNASAEEDALVAAILLNAASTGENTPDFTHSPRNSSLPIEEIEDGYTQFSSNGMNISRNSFSRVSSEFEHSVMGQTSENVRLSPPNSFNAPDSLSPNLHLNSESSIEKTSGFSDQTTPEERCESTPRIGDEEPSRVKPIVPPLNLGSGSVSLSPTSTPPSSERPSGDSSILNDRTSSITLYQPNTDRSTSTQDSTMSIPSDSVTRSQGLSSYSPLLEENVATESKETQCDAEKQESETTATNTDTPAPMTTTATNTELYIYSSPRNSLTSKTPPVPGVDDDKSLPAEDDVFEDEAVSISSRSPYLPNESNYGSTPDNQQSYNASTQQRYPINRPFSMSRSTEEKYTRAALSSISTTADPPRSELVFSTDSQTTEDRETNTVVSEQFDEDEYTKLTHQRQRYWMSKKTTETSLPVTPLGALSTVGAGTVYRKNNFESQVVVPRYSALPRTVSMLVNTSSQDCTSNSSDSDCLSLVDSLDEVPISPKHFKSDDVVKMLPEGEKAAKKPTEKPKAFFVPMDEAAEATEGDPVVATLLPDRLKKRLSSRHKEINDKRQLQVDAREQKEKEAREKELKEQKAKIAKARRELKARKAKLASEKSSKSKESSPREGFTQYSSKGDDTHFSRHSQNKPSLKSSIPVMKSSSEVQKFVTSPRNSQQTSNKPSQLPVRSRHQPSPMRRSANLLNRFQQRFEVIPEEKSGSLESSYEETKLVERVRSSSLPVNKLTPQHENDDNENETRRFTDTSSPRDSVRSKRSERQIKTPKPIRVLKTDGPLIESVIIQEVDEDQEEMQVKESYKGREALAPHTEEGMPSLSKGWINFYLLKDGEKSSPDTSSSGDGGCNSVITPMKTVKVVGGSSSRIRTYTVPYHSPSETKSSPSLPALPELRPVVAGRKPSQIADDRLCDYNGSEKKSITAYLHLPSPRVQPPHLFDGSGERASSESSTVTSSEGETERSTSPAMLPIRWPVKHQHRKMPSNQRTKSQHYRPEAGQHTKQNGANVGWTVTVAGTNNQSQPDVEMRLTFPTNARRPPNSQSDSGVGEDNNNVSNKNNQDDNRITKKQHFLPPATANQGQQRWTLTVKNAPDKVLQDFQRSEKTLFQCLPELPQHHGNTKSSKKANKSSTIPVTTLGDDSSHHLGHFSTVWPRDESLIATKVFIRKTTARYSREVKSVTQLMADAEEGVILRSGLAVTGSAISPEKKPRVQTMSERDLTRGHTAKR